MKILIDAICCFCGGFLAVVICSKYDSWQRYKKKIGKGAYDTVYTKILNIEQDYFRTGNIEASNDCIRLQNLMNYFKEKICNEDN